MRRQQSDTLEACCDELAIRLVRLQQQYPWRARELADWMLNYVKTAATMEIVPASKGSRPSTNNRRSHV